MSILTDTAPRRIYLCVSDDEDHYDEPWPERYPEDDAITWSVDQPVACTVEYERADIVDALRRQLAVTRATLQELRVRMHAAGQRPEQSYEMCIIDDALAAQVWL